MEKRIEIKGIRKSPDPNKLVVYYAASLKDEIRFYLNDTQYVSAKDNHDGTLTVQLGEKDTNKDIHAHKSTLTIIKEHFKEMLIAFFISILMGILFMILAMVINNLLVYLFLMNFTIFFACIVSVIIEEYKQTPPSLKSTHSAEHMMANFVEKNKRLPTNMEEIKKTTRFCNDCGSRKFTRHYTEDFVQCVVSGILTALIGTIFLSKDGILFGIIFIGLYFVVSWIIGKLMRKYGILDFIIEPIQDLVGTIIQCSNTTRNVKDTDIRLAYCAAKYWMQIVYPEFYTEDEDNSIVKKVSD